ncbi:hypothetical protein CRENBAI_002481 [Crenichthys baileyi]|uniref:Uncharacterized protein n=1 Tax=Crenichthys baileyi TaxID=28760 RepID=A0AAV9STJ1_9TELE
MGSSVAVQVHPGAVEASGGKSAHQCPGAQDDLLGAKAFLALSRGQASARQVGNHRSSVPRQPPGWDKITSVPEGGPEAVDLGIPSLRLHQGNAPTGDEELCGRLSVPTEAPPRDGRLHPQVVRQIWDRFGRAQEQYTLPLVVFPGGGQLPTGDGRPSERMASRPAGLPY